MRHLKAAFDRYFYFIVMGFAIHVGWDAFDMFRDMLRWMNSHV